MQQNTKCYCGHTTTCDCGPEEPKQVGQVTEKGIIDTIGNCPNCGVEFHIHKDITEPKQETLEEAAENYSGYEEHRMDFIEGAKWQQERSYSEEEVLPLLEILQKCKEYFLLKTDKYSDERADAIIDVMEQFKKK